ncbi:MAG: histidine phosphatase family protein [Gammaproteobacteria bacterium]|nr:histidine phosphatase family protein [Gammaproteobacteria bacterium]NNL52112.1 histidine phosphatase family protein [Woeseiaceae bacterium]
MRASKSPTKKDIDRRRRRRRRRLQVIVIYAAIAVGLAWFFESQATTTLIFVRHAEKATMPQSDPGLTEAGQRRAAELARQLADADVVPGLGVDAVYSTSFRRNIETATPVADALGLQVMIYDVDDTEAVIESIVKDFKGKIVLVVGHSDTIPELIANMGASKNVPPIAADEYDNIYLVTIPWFGKTKTIRLRYGEPYLP